VIPWKAKHQTFGNSTAGAAVPIAKNTRVVTNLDSPMQPQMTFWIESGNGDQLWLDNDQFHRDFERAS
jgi:hypothetical protein